MQKDLTKTELESLEHKEDILYYIRDGFGEVLSCIHDIVGPEEYSRLCDQFKTERVMDEEEYKKRGEEAKVQEKEGEEKKENDDNEEEQLEDAE